MELRRDSPESQLASTESDKPAVGKVYESDSSNYCMLSRPPAVTCHLADKDTSSSARVEGDPSPPSGESLGGPDLRVKHPPWLPRRTGDGEEGERPQDESAPATEASGD